MVISTVDANAYVVGIDEVGRGCLAGPVVAGCVALSKTELLHGCRDSKQLNATKRQWWDSYIRQHVSYWGIGWATVTEINHYNILQATFLAMQRAAASLRLPANTIIDIDGHLAPKLAYPTQTYIGGDKNLGHIAAASIIAKVWRDQYMHRLHLVYPDYGFIKHVGYPTVSHRLALKQFGITPCHRLGFRPVAELLSSAPC